MAARSRHPPLDTPSNMAHSIEDSIDDLVSQHQMRQDRVDSIKQTVKGFLVYKASSLQLALLCEQYEKLVNDMLLGASDGSFGLIDEKAGEILVNGTATWERILDEVHTRVDGFAVHDLRSQVQQAAPMKDYITNTQNTILQSMTKFSGNISLQFGQFGGLFREFQSSHQDTFSIVPNAWMGKGKMELALGADLTELQRLQVTMARAARATNRSRVDTPNNEQPFRTMITPRDNIQSPGVRARINTTDPSSVDQIGTLLREFEKTRLVPMPAAPITSLPHHTLAISIDNIASTRELRETAITLRDAEAGTFMDLLLVVLDQRTHSRDSRSSKVMKLLQDLSDESDSLPPSLYISKVTTGAAVKGGGEAQIWGGSYNGVDVAIRQFQQQKEMSKADWRKIIRREIIVHRHLRHENILHLIGVFGNEAHPFCVVTPWMHNGDAREYLKTRPDKFLDITRGSTAGLAYLHGSVPPVIHGDIHSENILVDSEGNAQLCDFGLSRIQHEAKRTRTKTHEGGYPRNQAPEIISGDDERLKITPQTDMYALSMTIYELGTRTRPLDQYTTTFQAWVAVGNGKRPTGPENMEHLSEREKEDVRTLWPLLEQMWAHEPTKRPCAIEAFEELRGRNNFGVKMPLAHIHPMYAAYNQNP